MCSAENTAKILTRFAGEHCDLFHRGNFIGIDDLMRLIDKDFIFFDGMCFILFFHICTDFDAVIPTQCESQKELCIKDLGLHAFEVRDVEEDDLAIHDVINRRMPVKNGTVVRNKRPKSLIDVIASASFADCEICFDFI